MSADCINGVFVHHHCNVQVTVMSTVKQLPQLVREAFIVGQIMLVARIPRFWEQNVRSEKFCCEQKLV